MASWSSWSPRTSATGTDAAERVEPGPGIAPGVAVVERLEAGLVLPQRDHQRRARHRLGDRDAGLAQPLLHRLGAEHHARAWRCSACPRCARAANSTPRTMLSSRCSSTGGTLARSSGDTMRSTSSFTAFCRASRIAVLARLHGVGAGDVDIDAADRIGVAAGDLGLRRTMAAKAASTTTGSWKKCGLTALRGSGIWFSSRHLFLARMSPA